MCCQTRIQVVMNLKKTKKKNLDVDMLKSSEMSYNKRGSALFNSQSTSRVPQLAVIYKALFFSPFPSAISLTSSSQ